MLHIDNLSLQSVSQYKARLLYKMSEDNIIPKLMLLAKATGIIGRKDKDPSH